MLIKNCLYCKKEFKTKFRPSRPDRGKYCSPKCLADIRRGKTLSPRSKEWRMNLSKALTGNKISEETKKKLSNSHKGEKSGRYIDGRCSIPGYKNWYKKMLIHRRREIQKTSGHSFAEWENLRAQYNFTCPCCKRQEPEIKLTIDHIIPLSRGGSDNIENIQPLCLKCNMTKHTKTIRY